MRVCIMQKEFCYMSDDLKCDFKNIVSKCKWDYLQDKVELDSFVDETQNQAYEDKQKGREDNRVSQ